MSRHPNYKSIKDTNQHSTAITIVDPNIEQEEEEEDPLSQPQQQTIHQHQAQQSISNRKMPTTLETQQPLTTKKILQAQQSDPFCISITQQLVLPQNKFFVFFFFHSSSLLYRKYQPKKSSQVLFQIVIPLSLRNQILHQYHDSNFGGHFGPRKTIPAIQSKYYWNNMENDIIAWCRNCEICISRSIPRTQFNAELHPIKVSAPWEIIACDCITFPTSTKGNNSIVVFMDYFTKYPEAFAVSDIKATTIANLFINEIICRHGSPKHFLTDRGSNFTSKLLQAVCTILQVNKIFTTPYHPQCDGLVERYNRTLSDSLAKLSQKDNYNWEKYLPFALFTYRISPHISTKFSPFFLLYGRDPILPMEIDIPSLEKLINPENPTHVNHYISSFQEILGTTQEIVKTNINNAQQQQKDQYDKNICKNANFTEGDIVTITNRANIDPTIGKLSTKQIGPYRIIKLYPNATAKIAYIHNPNLTDQIHLNRLTLYPKTPNSDLIEPINEYTIGDIVLAKTSKLFWPAEVINFSDLPPSKRNVKNSIAVQFFTKNSLKEAILLNNIIPISDFNSVNDILQRQRNIKGFEKAWLRAQQSTKFIDFHPKTNESIIKTKHGLECSTACQSITQPEVKTHF